MVRLRNLVARIGEKAARMPPSGPVLSTQPQFCNQGTVSLHVLFLEVPKQAPTLADHHEQAPPTVMILLVDLQVVGEVIDPLSEQRNLDLGGTRVRGMRAVFLHN
jgi:hypothetical protein